MRKFIVFLKQKFQTRSENVENKEHKQRQIGCKICLQPIECACEDECPLCYDRYERYCRLHQIHRFLYPKLNSTCEYMGICHKKLNLSTSIPRQNPRLCISHFLFVSCSLGGEFICSVCLCTFNEITNVKFYDDVKKIYTCEQCTCPFIDKIFITCQMNILEINKIIYSYVAIPTLSEFLQQVEQQVGYLFLH